MHKILAKPISYDGSRKFTSVKYIVIHNTGKKNDTAVNNGKYFATSNTRAAGAHFFGDRYGDVVQSIYLSNVANAVGGKKYSNCSKTGGGKKYRIVTNFNSVSIELCDIVDKYPSKEQIKAVIETIKYIRKSCPNAKTVVRHFDVTGKACPKIMTDEKVWKKFLKDIGEDK